MGQFERGEISRTYYLREMGAISLKADTASSRNLTEVDQTLLPVPDEHEDSEDSLSETRPPPQDSEDSDLEQEDPFENLNAKKPQAKAQQPRKKASEGKKQLCPVCRKGFQLRRDPPLHLACTNCGKFTHLRCIKSNEESFVCVKCKDASMPAQDQDDPSLSNSRGETFGLVSFVVFKLGVIVLVWWC